MNDRKKRKAAGFEFNPPRCVNCDHYDPPVHAVAGLTFYKPRECLKHGFTVETHSICDDWLGRSGETLTPEAEPEAAA